MDLLGFLSLLFTHGVSSDASNATTEAQNKTCGKTFGDLVYNSTVKLWHNGMVPFTIDSNFTARDLETIHEAFGLFDKYTCVRFRPKTDADKDFLHINNIIDGCITTVGFYGGEQFSTLESPMCTRSLGTVLHEMMHVLGFYHEHSRWDRDNYVDVIWDRVRSDSCGFFTKRDANSSSTFGEPYDFRSVLHYYAAGFSVNGMPTLVAKNPIMQIFMGQRRGFSRSDIVRINKLYGCLNENPAEDKIYSS